MLFTRVKTQIEVSVVLESEGMQLYIGEEQTPRGTMKISDLAYEFGESREIGDVYRLEPDDKNKIENLIRDMKAARKHLKHILKNAI